MAIWLAIVVVLVVAAALAGYAMFAPRRKAEVTPRTPDRAPLHGDAGWNEATGQEFASMNEAARCDMIFAVAALDDDRSQQLLEHALDDPSEAVALAAAHALVSRGRTDVVEDHLAGHPGERASRIAQTLALLAPERTP